VVTQSRRGLGVRDATHRDAQSADRHGDLPLVAIAVGCEAALKTVARRQNRLPGTPTMWTLSEG